MNRLFKFWIYDFHVCFCLFCLAWWCDRKLTRKIWERGQSWLIRWHTRTWREMADISLRRVTWIMPSTGHREVKWEVEVHQQASLAVSMTTVTWPNSANSHDSTIRDLRVQVGLALAAPSSSFTPTWTKKDLPLKWRTTIQAREHLPRVVYSNPELACWAKARKLSSHSTKAQSSQESKSVSMSS